MAWTATAAGIVVAVAAAVEIARSARRAPEKDSLPMPPAFEHAAPPKGLALDPRASATYLDLADALVKTGKPDEAVPLLEKHIELEPGSVAGLLLLGEVCLQTQDLAKAKKVLEAAAALAPENPHVLYALGTAYARLKQSERSKECLARCLKIRNQKRSAAEDRRSLNDDIGLARENAAKTYTDVGRVYAAARSRDEAELLWRRAATLDPKNVDCRALLIVHYQETGRPEQALVLCEELVRSDPANVVYHINVGMVHVRLGRLDAAEQAFRRATEVAPKRYEGYAALVQLYLRTDRKLPEARSLAAAAVQLNASAQNHYLLAVASQKAGDPAGARKAIARALQLEPNNPQFKQVLDSLDRKGQGASRSP